MASQRKELASESKHGFGKAATSSLQSPARRNHNVLATNKSCVTAAPEKINQAKPTLTAQYARKLLIYDAETGVLACQGIEPGQQG
jgi:hypothetical protein